MTNAIETPTEQRNRLAEAILDQGWYRGNSNGPDYCEWCSYVQEPHWKKAPERHAHDCIYVYARNIIHGQTEAEALQEKNRDHA